jgi:hypothetical protein
MATNGSHNVSLRCKKPWLAQGCQTCLLIGRVILVKMHPLVHQPIIFTHVALCPIAKKVLANIIIVKAYSPLDSFTKPISNSYDVQTSTKAFSTSISLEGWIKIELSSSSMMWTSCPFNWLNYLKLNVNHLL